MNSALNRPFVRHLRDGRATFEGQVGLHSARASKDGDAGQQVRGVVFLLAGYCDRRGHGILNTSVVHVVLIADGIVKRCGGHC